MVCAGSRFLAVGVLALSCASPALALPAHKKALADHFGKLLPARMNDCAACHAPDKGTEPRFNLQLPKPHNAFGARLMAAGALSGESRTKPDIATRLQRVLGEDSDGDGFDNLTELLLGRNPGSRTDRPGRTEHARAPRLRALFEESRRAYPWKPFERVARPPVPGLKGAAGRQWARNPIDVFVAAEHQKRGLRPQPEAPRDTLLRRVYIDLTGLPPTREERAAFLSDRMPDAYERVVDRLLASPQYGERWARHWMDVWRYSDWDGYGAEVRNSKPHIWRWRDWIVSSLNEDKGYDRMVQEMLAGDELAPEDPAVLPATGFLVRNWYLFNRQVTLNNIVEHTSKAFLGVTLNCARCHDHKYDPVSQQDYFNFRAFFEPHEVRLERIPGQPDPNKDGIARIFDGAPDAKTLVFIKGDERKPDPKQPASPALPAALGGPPLKLEAVPLPFGAWNPERRPFVLRESVEASEKSLAAARAASDAAGTAAAGAGSIGQPGPAAGAEEAKLGLEAAEARHAALLAILRVEELEDGGAPQKDAEAWKAAAEAAGSAQRRQAVADARLKRFEAQRAVEKVEVAAAAANSAGAAKAAAELATARQKLGEAEKALVQAGAAVILPATTAYTKRGLKSYPASSTGRRLALARWITDRANPLAARVAVNHIWLRHFGKALAPSVSDFGGNGRKPIHPALLDWLAFELMDGGRSGGWRMKRIHRLIVTSSTYRMDSRADAAAVGKDPENRFLSWMNARRMEAEAIRDSMLHVTDQLDPAMGGPDLDPAQGLSLKRRSLYFRHSVEKNVLFLTTFDQASVNECYERAESIMPQQALAMANSALSIGQSRLLARQLPAAAEADFIMAAFQQVLGRDPSAAEIGECRRFLEQQTALLAAPGKLSAFGTGEANPVAPASDPRQRARESLVHVLLNHHDFVTIR